MRKNGLITWQTLWAVILIVIVIFLAIYNLEYFPATWFDEGIHLLVAKKLALDGKYRFGPAVGPTVFYSIATAFRIAGVGLLSARIVMIGYLLLCVIAFYALTHYLGGWKVATVGTLLFISSPGINLLRWGRQVLGEVPASMFLLTGTLVWFKALEKDERNNRKAHLILAGILLGLAMITKNHFLLLLPAWGLLWAINQLYYRQAKQSDFILPAFSAITCLTAWYVGQRLIFPAGEHLARHNVQEWSGALKRGILTLSPWRTLDAIKFLTSQDTFYAWVLPGWLYSPALSLHRTKNGLRWALLALLTAVWFSWFILFSVSWPRYAFLALTVTAIFIAQLFHDLTQSYRFPFKKLWSDLHTERWDTTSVRQVTLMGLLLVIILRPLYGRFNEIIAEGKDTPQQMAAYITSHVPLDAEIETYEPEICFLTGHDCHLPPNWTMDAAIKYVWYNGPPPSEHYNFQEHNAPYLLIGDFGRWTNIYTPEVVEQHYQLCTSIGGYELYRIKTGDK